jgi:hypothetical protein
MSLSPRRRDSASTRHDLIFKLTQSSSTPPDLDITIQRASGFADAVKNVTTNGESVTLLSARDEHELLSYVITPGQGIKSHVVTTLCATLGAKATQLDAIDEGSPTFASTPYASFLVARPSKSRGARETQSGGDVTEIAGHLSRILQPGSWVALTLRSPTDKEINRTRRWFDHRRGTNATTHYTNGIGVLAVSIFAGAGTNKETQDILKQVVSVIPGFDLETLPFSSRKLNSRIGVLLSLAVGVAAGIVADTFIHRVPLSLAAGALASVLTLLAATIPPLGAATARTLRRTREQDFLPAPARRARPPARPKRGTKQLKNGQSVPIDKPGEYPLAPSSFLFGPAMTVGIVSPHGGNVSGVTAVESRTVPTALLENVGPLLAYADSTDADAPRVAVHIDAAEMFGGVGACGQPGTGKTTLLHNLWAWHTLERVRPSGRPNYPGARDVLVAFESKGEGAAVYEHWSTSYGDTCVVFDVADPATPALHVADPSLPPKERARMFVSAMKYAWDESAIQGLATETLTAVFTAAMACPSEVAATTAHLTDGDVTFVSLAHLLLGGGCTHEDAKQFFTNLEAYHLGLAEDHPDKTSIGAAVAGLSILFGADVTQSRWRDAVASSRNKVDVLMAVPHWWSSSRPHGSWKDALNSYAAVVVNSGVSQSGLLLDEEVGSVLASMTAYSLKIALQQNCSGWQSQGRYVSIFADEIAVLATSSSEVIEWLRTQGRAYGVRPFLACQWPGQLPEKVHAAFMSFATMFWFQQSDRGVIDEAVKRLSIGGSEWTSADIGNLEKFQAILHATSGGKFLPPAPVRMAYWTDPRTFAEDQGYL